MPHCCWGFLAGIVGTPLQKITKPPKWWAMKHDLCGVKRKQVAKDFSAEEVIRLMEDEEFSAWCEKTCQMTHLTKMKMKERSRRDGVGMLLTKFHIYSLFTTSHCAK